MPTFTLTIDTDNAAFDGDNLADELARILRRAADDVERGHLSVDVYGVAEGHTRNVRDVNGNTVGYYRLRD